MLPTPLTFFSLACSSLSFLVKLEQLDLGGNDLEVLVRKAGGGGAPAFLFLASLSPCGPFPPEPVVLLFALDPEWEGPVPSPLSAGPSRAGPEGGGGVCVPGRVFAMESDVVLFSFTARYPGRPAKPA